MVSVPPTGAADRASAELREGLALPALAALGGRDLIEAGIDARAEAMIRRTIDAYYRGNSANMISLTAIRLAMDRELPLASATHHRENLKRELDRFTGGLIPEMIAVGLMLLGAMP